MPVDRDIAEDGARAVRMSRNVASIQPCRYQKRHAGCSCVTLKLHSLPALLSGSDAQQAAMHIITIIIIRNKHIQCNLRARGSHATPRTCSVSAPPSPAGLLLLPLPPHQPARMCKAYTGYKSTVKGLSHAAMHVLASRVWCVLQQIPLGSFKMVNL